MFWLGFRVRSTRTSSVAACLPRCLPLKGEASPEGDAGFHPRRALPPRASTRLKYFKTVDHSRRKWEGKRCAAARKPSRFGRALRYLYTPILRRAARTGTVHTRSQARAGEGDGALRLADGAHGAAAGGQVAHLRGKGLAGFLRQQGADRHGGGILRLLHDAAERGDGRAHRLIERVGRADLAGEPAAHLRDAGVGEGIGRGGGIRPQ